MERICFLSCILCHWQFLPWSFLACLKISCDRSSSFWCSTTWICSRKDVIRNDSRNYSALKIDTNICQVYCVCTCYSSSLSCLWNNGLTKLQFGLLNSALFSHGTEAVLAAWVDHPHGVQTNRWCQPHLDKIQQWTSVILCHLPNIVMTINKVILLSTPMCSSFWCYNLRISRPNSSDPRRAMYQTFSTVQAACKWNRARCASKPLQSFLCVILQSRVLLGHGLDQTSQYAVLVPDFHFHW